MEPVALVLLGIWLLVYRLVLRIPRCRGAAEALTTLCCGASLAFTWPLLPFGGPVLRVSLLTFMGVLFSFCHGVLTALVVSMALGAGIAGMVWQLYACHVADTVPYLHPGLVAGTWLTLSLLLVLVPAKLGGPSALMASLQIALMPSLGALLTVLGISEMVGGLTPEELLAEAPCKEDDEFFPDGLGYPRAPLECLAAWLALAALGATLQLILARLAKGRADAEDDAPGGDLVQSLLPEAQDGEGPERIPRPGKGEDRYAVIRKAICSDEGEDLSHLTENERQIVEVCRKDEFERDRILWGGGLI